MNGIEEVLRSVNQSSALIKGSDFVEGNKTLQLYTQDGYPSSKIASFELLKAVIEALPSMLCDQGTDGTSVLSISSGVLGKTDVENLRKILGADKHVGFVDMGLPSGTLWSSKNVGAETIVDNGYYFSWGNVKGEKPNEFTFGKGFDKENGEYPYITSEGSMVAIDLPLKYDAANFYLGGTCHMPSKEDFAELFDTNNTASEWTTLHNTYGVLVTSRNNGNTVFFPAGGFGYKTSLLGFGEVGKYWTRSLNTPSKAHLMQFGSQGVNIKGSEERHCGFTVRPIL